MYIVAGKRALEKDRVFCFIYLLAGLVFIFGIFVQNFQIKQISWKYLLESLGKMTFQSNLLAFITAVLYLFKPNHKIFLTNVLPLISCSVLWMAGIGFWCLLFPIYYIDLSDIIISINEPKDSWATFYVVWNHSVTQILFLFFFYFINKKKNLVFLVPITVRKSRIYLSYFLVFNIVWNIIMSFFIDSFPTYGIFTNYNPNLKIKHPLNKYFFDIRLLFISHTVTLILLFVICYFLCLLSIKWRSLHSLELLGNSRVWDRD